MCGAALQPYSTEGLLAEVVEIRLDCPPRQSVTVCGPVLCVEKRGPRRPMKSALSDQIASLPAMSKAELLSTWAKNFSQAPPASLRKDLMVPILAYRIQEREYGGLANTTRKKLREIAK